ncbi:S8 family peptidase [Staphylococcus sciuri]|uniref:S8 family peptidase n=1 Tax=Mammaliicoccus sciuri TaxID=1296 RepID=UPI0013E958D9|nr:S8 family peptidase [Mammaliicoccus sciuri]NGX76105.1 S8 family peptidase [Mammaliicoccus sciuri]
MSEDYPIIKFYQREKDNARTPGGGSNKKPTFTLSGEDLNKKGALLLTQIREIEKDWEDELITSAPRVLEVTYIEKAKAKSHQEKIINMFNNYKNSTQIGAVSNDNIIIQVSSIDQLHEAIKKFKMFEDNDIEISAIEKIQKYHPKAYGKSTDEYNLTFWNFMDDEINKKVKNEVQKKLDEKRIENKFDSFGNGEEVIEVTGVTKDKLQFIKKLPIKSIEATEKINPPFPVLEELELKNNKVSFDFEKKYPLIGLLDSGVELNSYTSGWVTRGKGCFYNESELNKSHGTYIASLLIHGDRFNNTSDFSIQGCKIIDVPIIPNYKVDSKALVRNIEGAVKNNTEVKIWNLSVSIDTEIKTDTFSLFAKELDRIQEQYGVLIFKSAGNDKSYFKGGTAGKINSGGDSVRSVTVGSINRNSDSFEIIRKGYPSPYSRIGRGPSFIIKPELVHYGGDIFPKTPSPKCMDDYEFIDGLGISENEKIIKQPGTSFSTPKVAKIAAEIQTLTNLDDLLMIKAMLIHSASHSKSIDLNDEDSLKKMGFGRPLKAEDIIKQKDNHSITMVLRGRLNKGKEIDIMDFPFPNSLIKNNKFKGRIVITLVADPYLKSDLAAEYCQTNIDIKFGTYDKKEDVEGKRAIFNPIRKIDPKNVLLDTVYSKKIMKTNSSYNYERTLIKYGDKYYPVKKYACDLAEFKESQKKFLDSDRSWFVYLKGEYRNYIIKESEREHSELGIDFCAIITIYDPDNKENVYDFTIKELENQGFNYNSINLENEILIENDIS